MTMYVYSLDYDGCMAEEVTNNEEVTKENEGKYLIKKIIDSNSKLLNEIIERINAGHKVTLCVGSNRQNRHVDSINSAKTPSVFSTYPALVNYIRDQIKDNDKKRNIQFDNILTADTINDVAPGTHFKNECEKIDYIRENRVPLFIERSAVEDEDKHDKPKCIVDQSKISILYAQMHHFASLHPSKKIEFIFTDDKVDILNNLQTFYSQHSELIPKNVTLKLEQKISITKAENIGSNPTEGFQEASIDGKSSSIDFDYAATSTAMFVIAYNLAYDDYFKGISSTIDLKNYVKSIDKSTNDIYQGYLSASSDFKEAKTEFFTAFNQFKKAREAAQQSKEELSKRMNVLVDVGKEAQQNTLTSDHEFQAFEKPIKHASYNVAVTGLFCMKDRELYQNREFMPRLEQILGEAKAREWNQQRQKRVQEQITAAAKQGIPLFNLQETSYAFVQDTLSALNKDIPNKYQATSKLYNNQQGNLFYNLAIIYDSEKLTPIGDAFIRDDLTSNRPNVGPDRVLVQAFKDKDGNYIVMQNIHGQHYSNAKEGEKNLAKAMMLPNDIKTKIEDAIKNDGGNLNYAVCLSGDTNRRRPPTDDKFKYIGVNTSTVPEGETFWHGKHHIDYTDGSFFARYESGKLKEETIQVVNSETLDSNGKSIAPVKVSAEFALANNHFQEFPCTSQYDLNNFQNRFKKLGFKDCDITPEKNDFNVCRVKITSKKNILSQLEQEFKYVEKIQTSEGVKYTVYPNEEIAKLKIEKRGYLEKSMRSELMNLVIEGNTDRLGITIKEWLDCYPDLLKNVLEINDDINKQSFERQAYLNNDIFLNCASSAKYNLGEAWGNNVNEQFPNRPSISAILNYAAHQVGVEHFGDLNKYSEPQKILYLFNKLDRINQIDSIKCQNIYLAKEDNQLLLDLLTAIARRETISRNDELSILINFLHAFETELEPPLRVLEQSPTRRELSISNFSKAEDNYNQAKNKLLEQIDINKQIKDQIEKRKVHQNESTQHAKRNIAFAVTAGLVGGAAIAAIILTAPFSLPIIIGLSLIGAAITTVVLTNSSRARNFLTEATKSQYEIDSLNQFLQQISTSFGSKIEQSINKKKDSINKLEQSTFKTNNEINAKMDAIPLQEQEARRRNEIIEQPINRKKAEEEIQANTSLPEKEKYALRTKALSKNQLDIIEKINNLLPLVGDKLKTTDVRESQRDEAIKLLKKLPPDIQSHFQDYFYEQEGSEWRVKLDLGIQMVKDELSKNPIQTEQQSSYATRQNAAGILFFKQSPISEKNSIQTSQHNKEQLKTIKNDSKETDVLFSSHTCPF